MTDELFPYREHVLENGLRVITQERPDRAVAAVQLWYHVGSKNEQPHRRGFAHMFEHMMFRGTDRLGPEGHFENIRRTGGEANAFTAFDQTVYVQEVPANQVELVFWLESERMAFLRIDDEGFRTERKVVGEELRMIREAPYGTLPEVVLPQLFPGHSYAWTPGGHMSDLIGATSGELQEFWERYYVPANATLVVVGGIDHEEIQELAERYFGWIPDYPAPSLPELPQLPSGPLSIRVKERNGPAPIVGVGYRGVPAGHDDALPLSLLAGILGSGESSRLYRSLVAERKLAVMAVAQSLSLESAGLVGAVAILPPVVGRKKRTLDALRGALARLRGEGPTPEELEKARNNALRSTITALMTASSRAQSLGHAAVVENDLPGLNRHLEEIRSIDVARLREVAERYLTPERELELVVAPSLLGFLWRKLFGGRSSNGESAASPVHSAHESSGNGTGKPGLERPVTIPTEPPIAPPIESVPHAETLEARLGNGLRVVTIEDADIPFVTVMLGVEHGAAGEDPRAPGTAAMAAAMVTRGTRRYDYATLSEALGRYAITIEADVDMDVTTLEVGALTEHAPRAMELLAEVVRHPTFPRGELDVAISQARTSKRIQEKDPSYIADRALRRVLFGEHPYCRNVEGELADLASLSTDGLDGWWRHYVRPESCVLYVVGDLTRERSMALADRTFGDWGATGEVPRVELPPLPEDPEIRIHLVPRAGEQTQIRVGQKSILRTDPRYFLAQVVNEVFGGAFNSRLNRSLRIEKGLTYGVRGGISAGRYGGEFTVSTFSRVSTTAAAVRAILDEIARLRESPPTEEEVEPAKSYLSGSTMLARQSPASVIADHWLIEHCRLPSDYFDCYLQAIAGCDAGSIASLPEELIDPGRLQVVVVGPERKLRDELLEIAPVTVVG